MTVANYREAKIEATIEFVLPLLHKTSGADDEAALQVAAGDQLLYEKPRHDGLARAGIIRQQKAQRLLQQHRLVDRSDLVRQRIHQRRVDRQHGIEKVREADPVRLRH